MHGGMSLRVSNARYQECNHQNEWSFEFTKMNNRLVIRSQDNFKKAKLLLQLQWYWVWYNYFLCFLSCLEISNCPGTALKCAKTWILLFNFKECSRTSGKLFQIVWHIVFSPYLLSLSCKSVRIFFCKTIRLLMLKI